MFRLVENLLCCLTLLIVGKNIGSLHRTNYLIKEDKTTTLPNSGVYELLIVPVK